MQKLNIMILYKNHKLKSIPLKKINLKLLSDKAIKYIMIPYLQSPNIYIPIKPSTLYNFSKAKVYIEYQLMTLDYDSMDVDLYPSDTFINECKNIVDFINTVYNLYEFRAVSILLNDYRENRLQNSFDLFHWVIYPRRIRIEFYKHESNQCAHVIDSGDMGGFDQFTEKDFQTHPPQYLSEDRLNCLSEFMYTPCGTDFSFTDSMNELPLGIKVNEDNVWKKIHKPGSELHREDYFFYRLDNFGAYYFMSYEVYLSLLGNSPFTVQIIGSVITKYDSNILESLDSNKVPNDFERRDAIDKYLSDDICDIYNVSIYIASTEMFLIALSYLHLFILYLRYIVDEKLIASDPIKKFICIYPFNDDSMVKAKVLTINEATYDNLINTFLYMASFPNK